MRKVPPITLLLPCLMLLGCSQSAGNVDVRAALQGAWVAQSMETDGQAAPAEVVQRMRFTFKGDQLLLRGNFPDDREEECSYTIDPKQSPKHLEFSPPKEQKPVLAIFDVKGDELKICLRHTTSSDGRPTEFVTKPNSRLVLIVFKKQK